MFEYVCGARLTYNYVKVGGVMKDVDKKFGQMVENFLNQFDDRLKDYNDLLSSNQIFLTRTKGLGVISPEAALDWGLTGPEPARVGHQLRRPQGDAVLVVREVPVQRAAGLNDDRRRWATAGTGTGCASSR
jgi:NADH:ubiquinone oxidoreductase subunit D